MDKVFYSKVSSFFKFLILFIAHFQITPTGRVNIIEPERRVRLPIIRNLPWSKPRNYSRASARIPTATYRDRKSKLPPTPDEYPWPHRHGTTSRLPSRLPSRTVPEKHMTCSCSKQMVICCIIIIIIVLLLIVVAAVLLTMVLNKPREEGKLQWIYILSPHVLKYDQVAVCPSVCLSVWDWIKIH